MPESTIPRWDFYNPVRLLNAPLTELANLSLPAGNTLLVTSQGFTRRGLSAEIADILNGKNKLIIFDQVRPNPDLDDLDRTTAHFATQNITTVIGLGGGSALDAAKVLSLTLPSQQNLPLDSQFRQQTNPDWQKRLALVTIPTTSGTGAEVTPFATVWDHHNHRKYSLASPLMFPDTALLDARLTLTLPESETLYPGLDTISHALESLWNRNATPFSRMFALQALSLAVVALPATLTHPDVLEYREKMQSASTLAGMAISQTRTAIAHAISYPITTRYGAPHGLACSFTLPALLESNLDQIAANPAEKGLLSQVLDLLNNLKLPEHLKRYISTEELLALKNEMVTPGRSDNYNGSAPLNIDELLSHASMLSV